MKNSEKLNKLKSLLIQEINKNVSDNDYIISLSNQIAALDETKVRFSIDAGVIDRLGQELVARQETAVSEIVKNSYDADASKVSLTFIETNEKDGSLIISDNGTGMTFDEITNGFMRISSTNKIHNPFSSIYKRIRAGQKGIGRFAVQRLGSKLTIITQIRDSEKAIKLDIDWNRYETDKDLLSISNSIQYVEKRRDNGTTLIISNLRDKWSEASIRRIYRYVSDIIQPYSISESKEEYSKSRKDQNNDPGFKVSFYKVENGIKKTIINSNTIVYDYATAIIEGYVDESGSAIYTVESKKLGINAIGQIGNDPDNINALFDQLKEVRFRAYYFIYDTDLIPSTQISILRRLSQTQGGIRLYRNGFRVLPYGEPSNDWLKLDKSVRTRSILPPHGNNNFFGFVELTDEKNNFNETSSREGLTENEGLIQLENFVYRAILMGVIKVAESRNIKVTTNQNKDEDGNWEKMDIRIRNIAHTLEQLDKELEDEKSSVQARKSRKDKLVQIKKSLEEINNIQKNEKEKIIKERSMLRVLSSVGLTIAQFIHEIKYYMDNIQSDVKFLIEKLVSDKESLERAIILDKNFTSFRTYTSYFDDIVSQNVIRDLVPINLYSVVNSFLESISSDAAKSNIDIIEPMFQRYKLYTKPMHPSEWASILLFPRPYHATRTGWHNSPYTSWYHQVRMSHRARTNCKLSILK